MKTWSAGEIVNASDLNANFATVHKQDRISLVLGETIAANKPAVLSPGTTTTTNLGGTATADAFIDANNYFAQKFTTPAYNEGILTVTARLGYSNASHSGNMTVRCDIYANSAGKPTGASLANASSTFLFTGAAVNAFSFTLNTAALSNSTDYHVVLRITSLGGTLTYTASYVQRNDTGGQGTNESTDAGSNWSAINGALYIDINLKTSTVGKVYASSASSNDFRANNFIGFTTAGGDADDTDEIITGGSDDALSGLTPGVTYYLGNTNGSIATSAGSQSRKIGLALSATVLLLKHDNV